MSLFFNPDTQFADNTTGKPLSLGVVYFGQPNQDPETNGKAPFSDKELTVELDPIQTLTTAGKFEQEVYLDGPYSITVRKSVGGAIIDSQAYVLGANPEIQGAAQFDTIASLRANTQNITRASLAGHTALGDGGGGDFWLDTSDTSTADDGGINIVDSQSPRTGTWKRIYDGELSVKWYGAAGDGVTDDTTAIQAALATAQPVFLPDGTYLITSQINWQGSPFRGVGRGDATGTAPFTKIQCNATPTPNARGESVVFDRTHRAARGKVSDIWFAGNTNNTIFGSDTDDGWFRVAFENIKITDAKRGYSIAEGVICHWKNCETLASEYPWYFAPTFNQAITFESCFGRNATDSGGYAFYCQSDSTAKNNNFTFLTCAVDDCDNGVFIKNARATFITCGLENHQNDFITGEASEITLLDSHYLSFDTGSGTGTILNLDSCEVFESAAKTVNNFVEYANLTNNSSLVSTGPRRSNVTVDSTSSYASLRNKGKVAFTPAVTGSTSSGVGTYTTQNGEYQLIDNVMHFTLRVAWTAHTGTGDLRVTLPIASAASDGDAVCPIWSEGLTFTNTPFCRVVNGSASARIYEQASGGSPSAVPLPSSGELIVSGSVRV